MKTSHDAKRRSGDEKPSRSSAGAASKSWDKVALLESFCSATCEAIQDWERFFQATGLAEEVLHGPTHDEAGAATALEHSRAWETLMKLFDYATEGVTDDEEEMGIVLDAASILKLVTTENGGPSDEWTQVLIMGDARRALDYGEPLTVERVALLANVDVRTVRNAVSAGELVPVEKERGWVDNPSARRWLVGRKGFKATLSRNSQENLSLEHVRTAAQFGLFLRQQRERIGWADEAQKVTIFHPGAGADTLRQLEGGVFALPLDAVFPIADFYQLDRKALLECVMRVFFSSELELLVEPNRL